QASELQGEIEGKVVIGDGSSVNTLAEANIGDCELFLALTSEVNGGRAGDQPGAPGLAARGVAV
ncbi:hypothetical protein N8604_01435, partial [bacterium]|nr:hypothetical protein [bacterium]